MYFYLVITAQGPHEIARRMRTISTFGPDISFAVLDLRIEISLAFWPIQLFSQANSWPVGF